MTGNPNGSCAPPLAIPPAEATALAAGDHSQPHAVLGAHPVAIDGGEAVVIRAFHPDAVAADCLLDGDQERPMACLGQAGLFGVLLADARLPLGYRIRFRFADGNTCTREDPYRFLPTLGEQDLYLFAEGTHHRLWQALGARRRVVDGIEGVSFAVWAPNARRVSVVGDVCGWDGRLFPMRSLGGSGVFELFIPGIRAGALYKYEIRTREGDIRIKSDPMAREAELPPATSSRVSDSSHVWNDARWMKRRRTLDHHRRPLAVYEVHLGSWARVPEQNHRRLSYREIAPRLVAHMKRFGFTHLQLMPVAEHPFDGSWGYQITFYYAPTARYGAPDDFRYLVDLCHQNEIGVILDWVPAHFPRDDFALRRFDGTPLYEHQDPRQGEHPDWGTLIFNYGRNEVRNFLLANALYWLEEFHVDGLRVDAVASILYRDYSRKQGEWVANVEGGRENLEGVAFLKAVNEAVRSEHPGCFTVAEESTAWAGVSRPVNEGGLGFAFKWNMGWMHDTLLYFCKEPVHRRHHQNDLTFAMLYEYTERFIMPLSHDEVVHGKRALLEKMPGDLWQKFANLRLLFAYQYTRPGKKLLFMGSELAPPGEWNHDRSLDWHMAEDPERKGLARFLEDLGRIYLLYSCLWRGDHEPGGFEWVDHTDHDSSVLSYVRRDGGSHLLVVLNFTPVPRENYRIGAPAAGSYRELLNSDHPRYHGSGFATPRQITTDPLPFHGREQSLCLRLPPLGALVLEPTEEQAVDVPGSGQAGKAKRGGPRTRPAQRPRLRELADRCGITSYYHDIEGKRHRTSDQTRVALLEAMGLDASGERETALALERLDAAEAARLVEPVRVVRERSLELGELGLRLPRPASARMRWQLELALENGTVHRSQGELARTGVRPTIPFPDAARLRPGYHRVRLWVSTGKLQLEQQQQLIVVPHRCLTAEEVLGARRAFGLWTHLYSLRSGKQWGIGDLGDLGRLLEWAAEQGAELVGLNPLHALPNRAGDISPYYPSSRLFFNPVYLEVGAVPELQQCPEALQLMKEPGWQKELSELRSASLVDYRRVYAFKRSILKPLHRVFLREHGEGRSERGRAYRDFLRRQGEALLHFATFNLLQEQILERSSGSGDHRLWPEGYQKPDTALVESFCREHQEPIAFEQYLQFETDRQLAAAARSARRSGLAVGVYQDLALGSDPGGCDAWIFPELLARGASLGAPPDSYNRRGQDWGLCPLQPGALREQGYGYFIALLRQSMQHAGALRIDHAMQVARQYWVPRGKSPAEGAYITYPTQDLMGIIALESRRNDCLVIGEDLGTVPEGFRELLRRWGVLGYQVFYFEREPNGDYRPASAYSDNALVTANTHDLATLNGFWTGADLEQRRAAGHIETDRRLKEERSARQTDRRKLLESLEREGVVEKGWQPSSAADLCRAVHAFLSRTPAPLLGVALDDLIGEKQAVNIPGIADHGRFNWRRRTSLSLEEIFSHPSIELALQGLSGRKLP